MRRIFLFLSIYVSSISRGISQHIEEHTQKYFRSDSYNKCQDIWKKYRVGYENSLAMELKGGYGHKTMNLFVKRPNNALLLSAGYYHSDNQVEILFQKILLQQFPYLVNPEISFDLCGNVLSIESTISEVIIHADYFLFRNKSDVIYSLKDQDPFESSPFRFHQVLNTGQMAVTAEKCVLSGTVFIKLDGESVNIGIDTFKLSNCQFSVDVYWPGQKTPPVLARYLFGEDGPNEKNILVQTLSKEMIPQLQAALFAHVNTSAIFDKDLSMIERQQNVVISEVDSYIDNVLRQINMLTIAQHMGTMDLEDFKVKWTDAFDGTEKDCEISLHNLTMSGIDSAYSAHIGGPYRVEGMPVKIAERVRMSNLQVSGKISLVGTPIQGMFDFAADIYDADIDMILDVQTLEDKLSGNTKYVRREQTSNHKVVVGGWRTLEFSCPSLEKLPIEALVTGYIRNNLPKKIIIPLNNVYKEAVINHLENEKLSLLSSFELENSEAENGHPENGDPENGDLENGDLENGDLENGDLENGDPENGDTENGDLENGDPENGDTENGDLENGDLEKGDPENGDSENGDLENGVTEKDDNDKADTENDDLEIGDPENAANDIEGDKNRLVGIDYDKAETDSSNMISISADVDDVMEPMQRNEVGGEST